MRRALHGAGVVADVAATGDEALWMIRAATYDAMVLDVMLPDTDGFETCRLLRADGVWVPIIMVTARGAIEDRVRGLDAGADDYLTKPFTLSVLAARVRALLRRAEPGAVEAGGVRVDPAARRAWAGEEELELSPKEFDLLALLVREAGRVVTRERIMAEVWDENWFGSTKTLDMHVSWLRRKLGEDASDPHHLMTVRGVGLRFEP